MRPPVVRVTKKSLSPWTWLSLWTLPSGFVDSRTLMWPFSRCLLSLCYKQPLLWLAEAPNMHLGGQEDPDLVSCYYFYLFQNTVYLTLRDKGLLTYIFTPSILHEKNTQKCWRMNEGLKAQKAQRPQTDASSRRLRIALSSLRSMGMVAHSVCSRLKEDLST